MATVTILLLSAALITFFLHSSNGKSLSNLEVIEITSLLDNIPEKERQEFLRYHLNEGYEALKKKEVDVYPMFHEKLNESQSILLYEYFSYNYLIKDPEKIQLYSKIVCFPSGCIDFGDSGVHPK